MQNKSNKKLKIFKKK